MKVALIHHWLVGMRGGEKVLEALCRMFPTADIFTHVYDPTATSDLLRAHRITTTFISRLPFATRHYQKYLPLMPLALEELDLSGYELVISIEAGPAKGVIAPPDTPHLCYCNSPMRYLWDQYHVYREKAGLLTRLVMPSLAHGLRQWDVTSAARVDRFMANSCHVAKRIEKYWRRQSDVVYPPVAVEAFSPVPPSEVGDYYLWVGELAPYKRPDIAVAAFTQMRQKLVVLGGPDNARNRLARDAGPSVSFLGKVSDGTLRHHMARCRALIFPGEEDFGIVPVEAMASGRPVIALGRGGALETVIDRETGLLYQDQSTEGLIAAVEAFERENLTALDPQQLVKHAAKFNETRFRNGIKQALLGQGIQYPNHGVNQI